MTDPQPRPPAPWWALNGYVLLVALLEVAVVGIPGIVRGPAGPIGWVYRVGVILAGLGVMYGLFARRTRVEAFAGGLMIAANLAAAANEVLSTYPPAISWTTVELQVIVIVGVSLRIWALWRGGVSIIPPWSHR